LLNKKFTVVLLKEYAISDFLELKDKYD